MMTVFRPQRRQTWTEENQRFCIKNFFVYTDDRKVFFFPFPYECFHAEIDWAINILGKYVFPRENTRPRRYCCKIDGPIKWDSRLRTRAIRAFNRPPTTRLRQGKFQSSSLEDRTECKAEYGSTVDRCFRFQIFVLRNEMKVKMVLLFLI